MFHKGAAVLAVAGLTMSSTATFSMVGVNCVTLSDYYRALGTVENGAYTCGMSMEQANRILGRTDAAQAGTTRPVAPSHRAHRSRKHRHAKTMPRT